MRNNRETGSRYEQLAAAYLQKRGYRILEANYRCPRGEVDLIGKKDGVLVFFEVKYRKNSRWGSPLEAVDERKRKRLYRTAEHYIAVHEEAGNAACRFDVIGILETEVIHIENAFGGM